MSIEIQFREASLTQAVTEFVQSRLFTLCLPDSPGLVLDHLDTVPGSAAFATAGGGVDLTLDVAVHVTTRALIDAWPNAAPPGIATPVGVIGVALGIGMVRTRLTISRAESDPSRLPLDPAARAVVKAAVDHALEPLRDQVLLDTADIAAALGDLGPADPSLSYGDGVVVMGFGAAPPARSRLAPAQQWGAFLDRESALELVRSRLPKDVPFALGWRPQGATPAIDARASWQIALAGLHVAAVTVTATVSISLNAPATVRLSAHWDIDLSGIAAPFEAAARKEARTQLRRRLGDAVVHDGAQSFHADIPLPTPPPIVDAVPQWRSLDSGPDGLTIGGPVRPAPTARRDLLDLSVTAFTKPMTWTLCRGVSGLRQPTVFGGASFDGAGALCEARILPPHQWLDAYLARGVDGVGFSLAVATAERITAPVRIQVRTARGSRLIDLGAPQIVRLPDGSLDVVDSYIDNCLRLTGAWLKIASGDRLTVDDFRAPPLEDPDWLGRLGAGQGLHSHLVALHGLEPGELVSLRSPVFSLDVTADQSGVATVPALVAITPQPQQLVVERASLRPIPDGVRITTTGFGWLGTLGPADAVDVRDLHGTAHVARRIAGEVVVEQFRPETAEFVRVEGSEVRLNPQPLPPEPPPESVRLAHAVGITQFRSIQALPGHDPGEFALIEVRDGESVIVERGRDAPRVSGRWSGPAPVMRVDGRFALAQCGRDIHLFAVESIDTATLRAVNPVRMSQRRRSPIDA